MGLDEPSTLPLGGSPQTALGDKWIRGYLGGQLIVDARSYLNVWEIPYWPWWFFRPADIHGELIEGADVDSDLPDGAVGLDLVCGAETLSGAARRYPEHAVLKDWVAVNFDALEHWFEEDVEVFVHPRSPYTRIDALTSSRHVVVSVDGVELANSKKPTVLFETGAPARFYLPMTDVRLDVLSQNSRHASCPYKGDAAFFDALVDGTIVADIAWTYALPRPESTPVAGQICFYNEIVDLDIDGERQSRPESHFK